LTVLDYIRTSIEILMNMKNDDEKKESGRSCRIVDNGGTASEFTSTI
jgi:hypothetical protein